MKTIEFSQYISLSGTIWKTYSLKLKKNDQSRNKIF